MAITTTTLLPAQVQQTFDYRLLSTPTPNLVHSIPSMKKRMPKNGGRYLRMSRYELLPTAPVPLGNSGITPPSTDLTRVDLDVKMDFYGQYIQLNEQVTLQNQDPRENGVVKSPLMDLKPLTGNAEGNKAEASDKLGTVNAVNEGTPKGDAVL